MISQERVLTKLVAASTQQARLLELFELQHDEGPCLDCYREGRAVANVDPVQAERRWPAFGAAVRAARFASVHAVPLRLRDEVIGAMNLFLADRATLTAEELALAQALADIATIGLLQERAVREQQVLAEQLQGALNSRTVIEQAKGVLAERHQLTLEAAFTAMRTHARRNGRPLLAVAADVIDGTFDQSLQPDL
ncbi:MAG: GAF and ANTAR domain-containing protein [Humibacillus sp.]|nr:GAF and ANTAR domain-containing protein [Humibacillus sp.]MDN5775435.1 GAF and ANTAR domain-containing protein [Humibacillus sp.]